jgi:hypothetical protein
MLCCITFVVAQASFILWCLPSDTRLSLLNHTVIMLAMDTVTTLPIMILAVPFIPTPRRLLLAILLVLGTFVLITGAVARTSVLVHRTHSTYLSLYTAESTLSIIFANLPFLTSLVVTAAPRLSPHLSLSQWPRSRRTSLLDTEANAPIRRARFDSVAGMMAEADDTEKGRSSNLIDRNVEESLLDSAIFTQAELALRSPAASRPDTKDSQVPKMRLSGGLAEMGELSLQDTTQGWPIYWR